MSISTSRITELESNRVASQVELDSVRSSRQRNKLGQFATPNSLAIELVQQMFQEWPSFKKDIRFADPSVGTGSFFSALLASASPSQIASSVGIEIDEQFARVAQGLWSDSGLHVICDDFTKVITGSMPPPSPNFVLANPPYVRHHHIDGVAKERLQLATKQLCNLEVNGLAGLYVYFLLLTTHWMERDGIAAWLIPSEFMDVNYGAVLRHFLANHVSVRRIHRFDPHDVQFDDALVTSAIILFQKRQPDISHSVKFTYGGTLTCPAEAELVSTLELNRCRKWTAFARGPKLSERLQGNRKSQSLSDLFRIRRGIATGNNQFFILKRSDAERLHFPACYLRPVLPSPRYLKCTVVESESDGYPEIDQQLCVIDCDLPEVLLKNRHPELWSYLQSGVDAGVKKGYLIGKRDPWYKQERRDPAPFLCTYMGRGTSDKQPFRFIWNQSQAIGTNLYLMLYPRKAMEKMFAAHPERKQMVFSLLQKVTGEELRSEGRVYGGGLNKIEPKELGRISADAFIELWPELFEAPPLTATKMLFE